MEADHFGERRQETCRGKRSDVFSESNEAQIVLFKTMVNQTHPGSNSSFFQHPLEEQTIHSLERAFAKKEILMKLQDRTLCLQQARGLWLGTGMDSVICHGCKLSELL